MNQTQFIERWNEEREIYRAWGLFVQQKIELTLLETYPRMSLDAFIKIAPAPRVKTNDSLIEKAFYREKNYPDPYNDIEDKVGLRFVVLLTEDIRKIQAVIESSDCWSSSLDRDFEAEREARPLEFVYQSKHFVLKAKQGTSFRGLVIPMGTPCEVQLRTLLQHAHSELTHDNLYKRDPGSPVAKRVERAVAKSMALIEAVDDYFVIALEELESATKVERNALATLTEAYTKHVGSPPNIDKSNAIVLHAFKESISDDLPARLARFLGNNAFVIERIAQRAPTQYIFRQPWILLAYLLVFENPRSTAFKWPLTPEELRPIYVDLGKGYPAS